MLLFRVVALITLIISLNACKRIRSGHSRGSSRAKNTPTVATPQALLQVQNMQQERMKLNQQAMGLCFFNCNQVADPVPNLPHLQRINPGFHAPSMLAVDPQGRFYVLDPDKHLLFITDALGAAHVKISLAFKPAGIGVDQRGYIFMGDLNAKAVHVWNELGEFMFNLGVGDNEFTNPIAIKINNNTGKVFVADSPTHQIRTYDLAGNFLASFIGDPNDPLEYPAAIAVHPSQPIFAVSDQNNERILVFSEDGTTLRSIDFGNRPQGMSFDANGLLYVTDTFESRVVGYKEDDAIDSYAGEFGVGLGQLRVPTDSVIDPFGRLAVVSYNNGTLDIFGPTGYTTPPSPAVAPTITELTLSKTYTGEPWTNPRSLNLTSCGNFVKMEIFIPGLLKTISDADITSVVMNDQVSAQTIKWQLVQPGDTIKGDDEISDDEISDNEAAPFDTSAGGLYFKFSFERQLVIQTVATENLNSGSMEVQVTGKIGPDNFVASETIKTVFNCSKNKTCTAGCKSSKGK